MSRDIFKQLRYRKIKYEKLPTVFKYMFCKQLQLQFKAVLPERLSKFSPNFVKNTPEITPDYFFQKKCNFNFKSS